MRFLTFKFQLKTGFSIVELLTVISLIGILATFITINFNNSQQKSRDSRRKQDLKTIQTALELARQDLTNYPSNFVTLTPAYIKTLPKDPKNNANYIYQPTPSGCSTNCSAYTLIACLENTNDAEGTIDTASCPVAPQKAYKITNPG